MRSVFLAVIILGLVSSTFSVLGRPKQEISSHVATAVTSLDTPEEPNWRKVPGNNAFLLALMKIAKGWDNQYDQEEADALFNGKGLGNFWQESKNYGELMPGATGGSSLFLVDTVRGKECFIFDLNLKTGVTLIGWWGTSDPKFSPVALRKACLDSRRSSSPLLLQAADRFKWNTKDGKFHSKLFDEKVKLAWLKDHPYSKTVSHGAQTFAGFFEFATSN